VIHIGPGLGLDPDMEVLNRYRLGPPVVIESSLSAFTAGDRPCWVESSRAMPAFGAISLGSWRCALKRSCATVADVLDRSTCFSQGRELHTHLLVPY
jgi:hypothetical protein